MNPALHQVLQVVGIGVLLTAVGYWVTTGHQSSLFVGAAMMLIGLGSYQGMRATIEAEIEDARRDGAP